jgi:hypothetical protein
MDTDDAGGVEHARGDAGIEVLKPVAGFDRLRRSDSTLNSTNGAIMDRQGLWIPALAHFVRSAKMTLCAWSRCCFRRSR